MSVRTLHIFSIFAFSITLGWGTHTYAQTTNGQESDWARQQAIKRAELDKLADLAKRLSNTQLEWGLVRDGETDKVSPDFPIEFPQINGAGEKFESACRDYLGQHRGWDSESNEVARLLLPALNEPNRFVIAHVLLSRIFRETASKPTVEEQREGVFAEDLDGLVVRLRVKAEGYDWSHGLTIMLCTAEIAPDQSKRISRMWAERLSRKAPAFAYPEDDSRSKVSVPSARPLSEPAAHSK